MRPPTSYHYTSFIFSPERNFVTLSQCHKVPWLESHVWAWVWCRPGVEWELERNSEIKQRRERGISQSYGCFTLCESPHRGKFLLRLLILFWQRESFDSFCKYRYHVKSDGPATILMMIGSVKTLHKYQISTSDNPLCCRGHCWGLVKWLENPGAFLGCLFVFKLRFIRWKCFHWESWQWRWSGLISMKLSGSPFQLFPFHQISSTKSMQKFNHIWPKGVILRLSEVGKGFYFI